MQPVYIGGAWADARAASVREIQNPATLKTIDAVPECGAEEVGRAVAAASAAQPAWSRTPPLERAALLREIAGRVRARALIESRDWQAAVRIA